MTPKKKEPAALKKKDSTPAFPELDANRHHDTRKNIPTEELRDFVAEDESKPPKMLYPRDHRSTRNSSGRARMSKTGNRSKSTSSRSTSRKSSSPVSS